LTEAIYAYRQEQQTLTGLSLSQIEEGVLTIVRKKYPSEVIHKTFHFSHYFVLFYL
jgi:hypothetical protein